MLSLELIDQDPDPKPNFILFSKMNIGGKTAFGKTALRKNS